MDTRKLTAEFIGTFILVFGGCGAAVLAGAVIGEHGVSLAFGLTVLCGVYAFGHVSGGHFNPAVTLGLVVTRRFPAKDAIGYIIVQVLASVVAAAVILVIAEGNDLFVKGQFAANGWGDTYGGYSLLAAAVAEVVTTAVFLIVILGATRAGSPKGTAAVAIGLALTLIHLVTIPVTNTSVNPARSTGPAIFAGSDQLEQLWLFWVAPLVGGVLGALIYRSAFGTPEDDLPLDVPGNLPTAPAPPPTASSGP